MRRVVVSPLHTYKDGLVSVESWLEGLYAAVSLVFFLLVSTLVGTVSAWQLGGTTYASYGY